MFTTEQLKSLGFDPDDLRNFDPTSGIVDPTDAATRGKWASGGVGKDAVFTLRVKNLTVSTKRVELFNALSHITKVPNDSQYSNYGAYKPFTPGSILNLISSVANTAEAGEPAITSGAIALFNDLNGDLVYIPSLAMSVIAGAPLDASNTGADISVKCSQVPYKRLIEDLLDLVLEVRMTKIQFSSTNQIKNPLEFNRVKSFGGAESNTIEPSEFFKPENNQDKVIDIPRSYYIDKQTGIYLNLEPSEDMQLTFYVKAYRNNGIVFA